MKHLDHETRLCCRCCCWCCLSQKRSKWKLFKNDWYIKHLSLVRCHKSIKFWSIKVKNFKQIKKIQLKNGNQGSTKMIKNLAKVVNVTNYPNILFLFLWQWQIDVNIVKFTNLIYPNKIVPAHFQKYVKHL